MAGDIETPTRSSSAQSEPDIPASGGSFGLPATPVWFDYLVLVGCSAVLCFGGFGLLLAVTGHFSAPPAFLLGAAGTVACTVLGRPARRSASGRPGVRVTAPAAGLCLMAAAVAAWNAIYVGHDVAVATDPGVYTTAGRWLASHQSLIVPAGAPWAGKGPINWASPGMYPQPNGTVQFQFAHLLPVLMAEGHKLGGDFLMFRVPALLDAIALGAIYATGCRLIRRPWRRLVAVTAGGVAAATVLLAYLLLGTRHSGAALGGDLDAAARLPVAPGLARSLSRAPPRRHLDDPHRCGRLPDSAAATGGRRLAGLSRHPATVAPWCGSTQASCSAPCRG